MILRVMVMEAMEAISIPTRYSKPSSEAVLVVCQAMAMATEVALVEPLSILVAILVAEPFSNLDSYLNATNLLSKTALYTTN